MKFPVIQLMFSKQKKYNINLYLQSSIGTLWEQILSNQKGHLVQGNKHLNSLRQIIGTFLTLFVHFCLYVQNKYTYVYTVPYVHFIQNIELFLFSRLRRNLSLSLYARSRKDYQVRKYVDLKLVWIKTTGEILRSQNGSVG